ncbi:MAG: SRPBCC family protein [Acidimicrobiia bacterium]|nr:SRPBCC family protein [Acidimicrobiia bacterium]
MATATAELTMNATPEAVWAIVRDFHGLQTWMPGIDSLESEGDDRILSMMGMSIRERLVNLDDAGKAITYAIVDGAPVESHEATITVHEADGGSRVTWDVTATPDEMAGMMQGIYQGSLDALKAHAGG